MTSPLILVAGFSQSARHRVVREALLRVDGKTSIAWLDHQDSLVKPDPTKIQPTQSFVACVCCEGSLVFQTHLTRLLRQGPWAAVIVSLGARAQPQAMLKLLNQPIWRAHLGPLRLFSVMDETALALCEQADHALCDLARQQRDCAEQVLRPDQTLPTLIGV